MPEEIAAAAETGAQGGTASTPAEGASAGAAASGGSEPTGIAKAMLDFDQAVTPKPKESAAVKPAAAAKPGETPGAKTGDKPVPAAKPDDDKLDWEKAPPRYKGAFFKHQRETGDKIKSYEERIKALEGKPREAAGDAKLIEGYQKQIEELRTKLSTTSYRESAEYKKQYIGRWEGEYKAAVDEVSKLQVTLRDAEGNETQRPATKADFDRILRLPPGDQDDAIASTFGKYSARIFARVLQMQQIERAAEQALQDHAETLETRTKESETKAVLQREEYEKSFESSKQELAKTWPQYFAPDENDPEATEALNKGYEYVDEVLKKSASLPPGERAAYNAVIRARAASFNRVALDRNRLAEEVKGLKAELEKFRGSDPGRGRRVGGETETVDGDRPPVPGSIAEAAAQFDK